MASLKTSRNTIPLLRPDLTEQDWAVMDRQWGLAPFSDDDGVRYWEGMWSRIWERRAIVFSDAVDAVRALKTGMGWRDGVCVATGTDLHPAWREGCEQAWIRLVYHDVDPQSTPIFPDSSGYSGVWVGHHYGRPVLPPKGPGLVVEDVSSTPLPLPMTGQGDVQLMVLDGNAMIQGGGAVVILCRDSGLATRIAQARATLPSALMVALGISQLTQCDLLMARRAELADRYLALRTGGWFAKPEKPATGRYWSGFYLLFNDEGRKEGLRQFLARGGILSASPWPYTFPEVCDMHWRRRLETLGLALPLYASLSDAEQKHIINRIHRWVNRGGPAVEA
ncbi:MAG: DegT/DnrJ/EryC1/StrS aminotransferase family protein [Magnetococcales bacterium]|nr:DegT/DnrJ/EryC1/StrS aminotransferase family protein [Magnetococcales bacterium]